MSEPIVMKGLSAQTRTTRKVHHVAKRKNAETGAVETGFVTIEEQVGVHDLSTPADKTDNRVFHRGARIA